MLNFVIIYFHFLEHYFRLRSFFFISIRNDSSINVFDFFFIELINLNEEKIYYNNTYFTYIYHYFLSWQRISQPLDNKSQIIKICEKNSSFSYSQFVFNLTHNYNEL